MTPGADKLQRLACSLLNTKLLAQMEQQIKDATGTAFRPLVLDVLGQMCHPLNGGRKSHKCYKNALPGHTYLL